MTPEEPIQKETVESPAGTTDSEVSDTSERRAGGATGPADSAANAKAGSEKTSEPPTSNEASVKPVTSQRINSELRPAAKPATAKAPSQSPGAPKPVASKTSPEKAPTPPPPFVAEVSLPVTMIVHPDAATNGAGDPQRFPGELEEDFASVLARVEKAGGRSSAAMGVLSWILALLTRAGRNSSSIANRTVAFDGFRNDLYDEKLERDRRYGTVYTVGEEVNAFLVRLEFPRYVPRSSLKQTWQLPDEMPDYCYTLSLAENVLSVRAGLADEVFRRLSYVSPSFPSDFLTRIEFPRPVEGFKHRLRDRVLEIVVFKQQSAGSNAAD